MKRIAAFIHDRSRLILAFVVIVNLVSLASFYRFNLDTDFLAFFSEGNPKAEAYNQLNAKYQSGETISVLVESDDSLLDKDGLLDVYQLQKSIESIDGVARVQSFIPPELMAGAGIIRVDETYIREQYDNLRDFIENKYFLAGQVLAEDGRSAILIASLEMGAPAGEVVDSLKDLAEDSPMSLSLAGNEAIKDTMWSYLLRILCILPPCEIVLVLLVFYLVLRNLRLTVLAIAPLWSW